MADSLTKSEELILDLNAHIQERKDGETSVNLIYQLKDRIRTDAYQIQERIREEDRRAAMKALVGREMKYRAELINIVSLMDSASRVGGTVNATSLAQQIRDNIKSSEEG